MPRFDYEELGRPLTDDAPREMVEWVRLLYLRNGYLAKGSVGLKSWMELEQAFRNNGAYYGALICRAMYNKEAE